MRKQDSLQAGDVLVILFKLKVKNHSHPGITDPFVESDRSLRGYGLKVWRDASKTERRHFC